MTDDKPADDGRCVACDVGFYLLVGLGALAIGLIAFDAMSGGKATEWIDRTFRKVGPALASVSPIREQGNDVTG